MTTQPLRQAMATTRSVLAGVTADQLANDTPCASWKVSDLINHIVGGQYFFLAGVTGTPPAGGEVDHSAGDYLSSFDEASGKVVEAFSADGVLEKMFTLPFGEMPGSAFMGLVVTDTFQHGWDLAKATGQGTDLAPELAAAILAQARAAIQDGFRGPEGAPFGPEQTATDGASNADRLAAFLGRSV